MNHLRENLILILVFHYLGTVYNPNINYNYLQESAIQNLLYRQQQQQRYPGVRYLREQRSRSYGPHQLHVGAGRPGRVHGDDLCRRRPDE